MRPLIAAILVVSAGLAHAQPGQTPPEAYPPPPHQPFPPDQPPPPPGYAPPAHQYIPIQLTAEEQQLLEKGEYSLGVHAGGVALNWLIGFGVGHAVQGRWAEKGWIFTLGEAASFTALVVGLSRTCITLCTEEEERRSDDATSLLIGGLLGYIGFHVWSIADAAIGPARHNTRVRALKHRLGIPVYAGKILPYVNKTRDGGGVAGLSLRF